MDEESRSHRPQLREKTQTPTDYTLSRRSLLNLHWNTPLADFIDAPGAFFEPDVNPTQTLGSFLSGEDGFQSYKEFRASLRTNYDKEKLKRLARSLHDHFPFPKELLEQNPDLLNWVPWHAVIAEGKWARSRVGKETEQSREVIHKATRGEVYTKEIHEAYPQGYIKERTEILLHRQNANARIQGVLEAIANSIDAIADREKIGQFGIGVKQLFTLLENTNQTFRVVTKQVEGELLVLEVKKGYDEDYYVRFTDPSEEDKKRFLQKQSGTIVEVIGLDLKHQFIHQLEKEARERFEFVAETQISANGRIMNDQSEVRTVGGMKEAPQYGLIDIQIAHDRIVINDSGAGMKREQLFCMVKPGGEKEFNVLTDEEAKEVVQEKGEVIFKKEPNQRFAISRNKEVVFAVEIPHNRIGTSHETICLELNKALTVSEGREGFELDHKCINGMAFLAEKVLSETDLPDTHKAAFLNSILIGLDQLNGQEYEGQQNELSHFVYAARKLIREKAKPFIRKLKTEHVHILPNFDAYGKVMDAQIFLDPYLLVGDDVVSRVLKNEGYTQFGKKEGITVKDGWHVFVAPLRYGMQNVDLYDQIIKADGLHELRLHFDRLLPVIIDPYHRIAMVDETFWKHLENEPNATRKAIMQEALQIVINEKVLTSYEQKDPRHIFIGNPQLEDKSKIESHELAEEVGITQDPRVYWYIGDRMFRIVGDWLLVTNIQTGEIENISSVPFESSNASYVTKCETTDGCWLLNTAGELMFVNFYGVLTKIYKTPIIEGIGSHDTYIQNISIRHDGLLLYELQSLSIVGHVEGAQFKSYDPLTGIDTILHDNSLYMSWPFLLDNGTRMSFTENGMLYAVTGDKITDYYFDRSGTRFVAGGERARVSYFYQNDDLYIHIVEDIDLSLYTNDQVDNFPDYDDFDIYSNYSPQNIVSQQRTYKVIFDKDSIQTVLMNKSDVENSSVLPASRNPLTGEFLLFNTSDGCEVDVYKTDGITLTHDKQIDLSDRRALEHKIPAVAHIIKYVKDILEIPQETTLDSAACDLVDMLEGFSAHERSAMLNRLDKIIASKDIKVTIHEIFDELRNNLDLKNNLGEIEQRFTRNLLSLSYVDPQLITRETIWAAFLSHNAFSIFTNLESTLALNSIFDQIDSLNHKSETLILLSYLLRSRNHEETGQIMKQMERVFTEKRYRNQMFNTLFPRGYLENDVISAMSYPETLDSSHPARSWLLFLSGNADLIRENEIKESNESFVDILPENVPLELIMYLRVVEGLSTTYMIRERIEKAGGIDSILLQVDLTEQRHAISVAIHGQGVGAGIEKRELIQNGVDAVIESGKAYGEITIDYYYREAKKEYVEEFTDNGTGVIDHVASWVPGDTTKMSEDGARGFFGSGFFREFTDLVNEGDYLERDSVTEGENGYDITREIFDPIRKGDAVIGVKLRKTLRKHVPFAETGTKVRIVRNSDESMPELEAMLSRPTYLSMGGLVASGEAVPRPVPIFMGNADGKMIQYVPQVEALHTYTVGAPGQEIKILKTPQIKGSMMSGGLFMSSLDAAMTTYSELVHPKLLGLMEQEHITVVASSQIPLIKDRSRFANEEHYIPHIQEALATEMIKQTGMKLLIDPTFNIPGMPEDLLTNPSYIYQLTNGEGESANVIAQKINKGETISRADAMWMNNAHYDGRLFLVLMHIEHEKDSLLRRMQVIHESSGNTIGSQHLQRHFNISISDTKIAHSASDVMSFNMKEGERKIKSDQLKDKLAEQLTRGDMTGITPLEDVTVEDKKEIIEFFRHMGFSKVYFVRHDLINAGGFFDGTKLVLSDTFLNTGNITSVRDRWSTLLHENAHLLEHRERSIHRATLDADDDRHNVKFTHQQDGSFGRFYKISAHTALTMIMDV